MTPRTLFTIILKILGIFFIKDVLVAIPQLISVILFVTEGDTGTAIWTLLMTLLILGVYAMVCYFLLFRTALIIETLRLFSYFQEKRVTFGATTPDVTYIVVSIVKILVGIILIGSHRPLVNLIERQRKK